MSRCIISTTSETDIQLQSSGPASRGATCNSPRSLTLQAVATRDISCPRCPSVHASTYSRKPHSSTCCCPPKDNNKLTVSGYRDILASQRYWIVLWRELTAAASANGWTVSRGVRSILYMRYTCWQCCVPHVALLGGLRDAFMAQGLNLCAWMATGVVTIVMSS